MLEVPRGSGGREGSWRLEGVLGVPESPRGPTFPPCPYLYYFLLNGGIPDVEATYFVSIEQKKENCLQKLPGLLVITKDGLICSANK